MNWFSSYLRKKEQLGKIFSSCHENKIGRYYQASSPYLIFSPPWSSWKTLHTVYSCFSKAFNLSALRCIFPRDWFGSTFLLIKILKLWAIKATKKLKSSLQQNSGREMTLNEKETNTKLLSDIRNLDKLLGQCFEKYMRYFDFLAKSTLVSIMTTR